MAPESHVQQNPYIPHNLVATEVLLSYKGKLKRAIKFSRGKTGKQFRQSYPFKNFKTE
ncbi:hypothetical protein HanPSC8_Chr06g0244981 [Helianthus annuus]|nr:hypothetical protein HanPSC8_Chr06g0244981 [Helianthus annuus]